MKKACHNLYIMWHALFLMRRDNEVLRMFPEYVKFFYDKLPNEKKKVYMQMYKGLKNQNNRLVIMTDTTVISVDDLMYIFKCLYNDTPSFYYVDPVKCRIMKISTGYIFVKDFLYSKKDIIRYDKAIINGLESFKEKYIRDWMTDYEKEIVIHDYLSKTVVYDEESIKSKEAEDEHKEIFNVLGPLLRKKAVCWGIACAFKLICDYCRIKCFVVSGDTVPDFNENAGHAWNIVKLDNDNYHVDVTWDIKKKGDISFIYDYLNLNDHLIKLDHTWDDKIYPSCNALTYNYYKRNKLYVRTLDQIPEYVYKKIEIGDSYITFKYANDMPKENCISEMIKKGISLSNYNGSYVWAINMDTHNVYIELKNA